MKTMTCKQLGGSCDSPIHGSTVDEMITNGTKHLEEMSSQGDEEHKVMLKGMQEMMKDSDSEWNKEWIMKFKSDFEAALDN